MTTSADGHTEKEEVQTPTHDSEPQLDDVCDSENSFGSDFGDDTTDEEKLGANADIEPELQPAYSDEDHPQSTSIPANMDRKSPLELQYSLLKFSGPLMCVVRRLILISVFKLMLIDRYIRSAKFHPPTVMGKYPIQPAG